MRRITKFIRASEKEDGDLVWTSYQDYQIPPTKNDMKYLCDEKRSRRSSSRSKKRSSRSRRS